jgi:hypothetical protein
VLDLARPGHAPPIPAAPGRASPDALSRLSRLDPHLREWSAGRAKLLRGGYLFVDVNLAADTAAEVVGSLHDWEWKPK